MKAGKLPRIIILDDCAGTRDMLNRVFSENLAAEVFATANSEEALAQALNDPPLIFLTDIEHSGPDGVELLKTLKKHRKTRDVRVWIVSDSVPDMFSPTYLKELGADLVDSKPCSLRTLLAKARQVLRQRRLCSAVNLADLTDNTLN